jgi:hypothetical protein
LEIRAAKINYSFLKKPIPVSGAGKFARIPPGTPAKQQCNDALI